MASGRRMPVEGRHGERCRRRCHPAGRRHGHDPSPDEACDRRSGQGRGERWPFAAPAQRSGLLGDQGLVLCSAARPPGGDRAGLLSRPDEPDRGAADERQRIVLDLPQEQYLEAVRQGQEAWADAVRAWSDSVQRMWGEAASTTTGEAPTAEQVIDNVFGFAEQLLAAQRDFAKRLVQATAPAADAGPVHGEVDDQEGDLLASIPTAASVVLVARRHDPRGQGPRPMTVALATQARQQQARSGRWFLEPVLLVGGCRRPAVGLDGFGRAGGRGAHTRPPGAHPLHRPRRRAHPVERYEADPLGRLTPLCRCSTAGRSIFRRAAANSGADGSAVRSARRAQRRRGKCASHR